MLSIFISKAQIAIGLECPGAICGINKQRPRPYGSLSHLEKKQVIGSVPANIIEVHLAAGAGVYSEYLSIRRPIHQPEAGSPPRAGRSQCQSGIIGTALINQESSSLNCRALILIQHQ